MPKQMLMLRAREKTLVLDLKGLWQTVCGLSISNPISRWFERAHKKANGERLSLRQRASARTMFLHIWRSRAALVAACGLVVSMVFGSYGAGIGTAADGLPEGWRFQVQTNRADLSILHISPFHAPRVCGRAGVLSGTSRAFEGG